MWHDSIEHATIVSLKLHVDLDTRAKFQSYHWNRSPDMLSDGPVAVVWLYASPAKNAKSRNSTVSGVGVRADIPPNIAYLGPSGL
jgi:hypothetical protein